MDPLNVIIQLNNIHCFKGGDPIGSAEPYLWAVFFKIDGISTFVDEHFKLQGRSYEVFTNVGDHGNLNAQDVNEGDDVAVPPQFGYGTTLTPIPFRKPFGGITHWPAYIGCLVVLLEQDNTSDSAVADGHSALRIAVEAALDELIPGLDHEPNMMDIGSLKAQVESAAIDAIWRDTRVFGWISAGGNMDDILGNHVFIYSQKEVLDAGLGGIAFEKRWQNVIDSPSRFGPQKILTHDWQIIGHIHGTKLPHREPHVPVDLGTLRER